MKRLITAFLLGVAVAGAASAGVIERAQQQVEQDWSAWGGQVGVRWNHDLLNEYGITVRDPSGLLPLSDPRPHQWFEVRQAGGLQFHVANGSMRNFTSGSLQVRGGYVLELADGRHIDLRDFTIRVNPNDNKVLDVVTRDGRAWFYISNLMFKLEQDDTRLALKAADLHLTPAFAEEVGRPEIAGYAIADVVVDSEVTLYGSDLTPARVCNPYPWPGVEVPGVPGAVYEADLFMLNVSPQYSRCSGCTSASNDGRVVFTPSSQLKNNVNDGTPQATIPQDPLGTSSALYTANVVWNTMFTGDTNPYGNDQHPYLIWNLYRIDPDGLLSQIGRSGVKHAWLTTNGSCLDSCNNNHSLGRGCTDTYGWGNNDANADLGPRSEIIPARGLWGRCGSIWDPDCDGSGSRYDNDNTNYDHRLIVVESQMGDANHPGSTYLFESWYLAREDINIYNSMATLHIKPRKVGSSWTLTNLEGYGLGPAIDRWVDPADPGEHAASTELAVDEGHARVAVKATDLGGGNWRYTYAVMNFDFSRAVTAGGGSDPDNPDTDLLRVVSNRGFGSFRIPLPEGSVVTDAVFSDGDIDPANDWNLSTADGAVAWTAPPDNSLDWGSLYSFAFTVQASPTQSNATLGVAEAGSPAEFAVATLAPQLDTIPADPGAAIEPGSIAAVVAGGSTATRALAIGNTGDAGSVLEFRLDVATTSCEAPDPVAWLEASPASGEVAAGATSMATLSIDAVDLVPATYPALVCMHSNDPENALIAVPVELTVVVNPAEVVFRNGFESSGGIGPGG